MLGALVLLAQLRPGGAAALRRQRGLRTAGAASSAPPPGVAVAGSMLSAAGRDIYVVNLPSSSLIELNASDAHDPNGGDASQSKEKPLMGAVRAMRTEMCWDRPNLVEHKKCLEYLGLQCLKRRTGKGICERFKVLIH